MSENLDDGRDAPSAGDGPRLKYYMFDWDDNILHMPTLIHLERKTDEGWKSYSVTTAEFARIRRDTENYRPRSGDWDEAFIDFYDFGERGEETFLDDTKRALRPIVQKEAVGGPSFRRFKTALLEGSLFAIITARAHSARSIRRAVEYFIETVLSAEERRHMVKNLRRFIKRFGEDGTLLTDDEVVARYLDLNRYRGVSSPEFQELMGRASRGAESPESAKQFAVKDFVTHVINIIRERGVDASISMGFSDDDPHNVHAVIDYLNEELAREFPDVKFVVYDTSDSEDQSIHKVVVRGK